jgi:hypothetical protein
MRFSVDVGGELRQKDVGNNNGGTRNNGEEKEMDFK